MKEAQKKEFPVRVYTVNEEKAIEKFVRAGSAAIITDYPEKAMQIRQRIIQE